MYNMEQIINQVITNFDFTLIIVINVLTYFIVKIFEELNGVKILTTWQKRIIFIIAAVIMSIIYKIFTVVDLCIIINSCIVAPINWSWLIKPIINKLGIDYKKI